MLLFLTLLALFTSDARAYLGVLQGCTDVNRDGETNIGDIAQLLVSYGQKNCNCAADVNGDNEVTIADLANVLVAWKSPCTFSSPLQNPNPASVVLDVNNDGSVTLGDWMRVVEVMQGSSAVSSFPDVTGDGAVDAKDLLALSRYFVAESNGPTSKYFFPHSDGQCCAGRSESPIPVVGCQGSDALCFCDGSGALMGDACHDAARKKRAELPDPCCCKARMPLPTDNCLLLARDACEDEVDRCYDDDTCCCLTGSATVCAEADTTVCAAAGGVCVDPNAPTAAPTPAPTTLPCAIGQHPARSSALASQAQIDSFSAEVRARADIDSNGKINLEDVAAFSIFALDSEWPCDQSCQAVRPDCDGDGTLTLEDVFYYVAPLIGPPETINTQNPSYCQ